MEGSERGRLRRADTILAGGALALLAFMLLLDWFGETANGTLPGKGLSGANSSSSGWETFTISRWIWLLTIVVALGSVLVAAGGRRIERPVRASELVTLLGALSAVLILYRIIHHPTASVSFGGFHASYGIKLGIWLGLAAALTIVAGGYLQMRAEDDPPRGPGPSREESFAGLTVPGAQASRGSDSPAATEERSGPDEPA